MRIDYVVGILKQLAITLFAFAHCNFRLLLLRNVIRQHQVSRPAAKIHFVPIHLNIDDRAVLLPMLPNSDVVVAPGVLLYIGNQRSRLLVGPDVPGVHAEKLFA